VLRVHLLAAGHGPGIYSGIARETALGVGLDRGAGGAGGAGGVGGAGALGLAGDRLPRS